MNEETNRAAEVSGAEQAGTPSTIVLRASNDAMLLELFLQPTSSRPLNPVYEDVMAAIAKLGVTTGIDENMLRAICAHPILQYTFSVAKGSPARKGADGYLIYLIETRRDLKPTLLENGTADYRDLGYTQNVLKGQPLCEIHKPGTGKDGVDIYGKVRPAIPGKEAVSPAGKNTVLNEDGTLLLAEIDGNAEVVKGAVHVNNVLRIPGNVDNATGDISFVGDVIVAGDVVSGFRVTAKGSVLVKGSVEAAAITADGDIVIQESANGMNRGSLVAGGNLRCKYIQSFSMQVSGNLYADSILYCDLECGGNVELTGRRAVLVGGRSTVAGSLSAGMIGAESHTATLITMASSGTGKNKELAELVQTIKTIDAENVKRLQLMALYDDLTKKGRLTREQAKLIPAVQANYKQELARRAETQERLAQIKQEQLEASLGTSMIICKNRVHTGTQITFGPLVMSVQHSFVNSRILVSDGEIRVMSPP